MKPNAFHKMLARIAVSVPHELPFGVSRERLLAERFAAHLGKTWTFWCWRTSSDSEGKKENTDPEGAAIYWRRSDGGVGRKVAFIAIKHSVKR